MFFRKEISVGAALDLVAKKTGLKLILDPFRLDTRAEASFNGEKVGNDVKINTIPGCEEGDTIVIHRDSQ